MNHPHINKNNKGYSLVEMIICIAVIAILSGVAMVTVSLIHSAKAKEASVSFTSELSDIAIKSKNQIVMIKDEDDNIVKYPDYSYCLKLYKTDGRFYIKKGYYNPDGTDDSTKYVFVSGENPNNDLGISLSSRVNITFTDSTGTEADVDEAYIAYDRKGRCSLGYGRYSFYNKKGLIAEVKINKNGSYQSY